MEANASIRIKDLELGYKPGNRIFKPITINAKRGELIALVGRNGVGKSTLLRTISGLQFSLNGSIYVEGNSIHGISPATRARLLSFVPSEPVKIPNLEVRNFIGIGRFPYTGWMGGLSESDWEKVNESIELVGIKHIEYRDITQISDGERQRAMIAFALAQDTSIILLDEPTAFLDLPNKFEMVRLLSGLASSSGKTIIYSTHDLQGAIHEADTIWIMLPEGLISGSPEDLALSNSFDRLLGGTSVIFDMGSGTFRNVSSSKRVICIEGEGLVLHWTKKMLQRIGYSTSCDSSTELKIICKNENNANSWLLERNSAPVYSFSSISELSNWLKADSYL